MADDWGNTALVIDMQRDFIEDGAPMKVNGGKDIIPNVIKAVEVARECGMLVVWVVHEHDPLGRDVELLCRHFYASGKAGPTIKETAGVQTPNCIRQTVFDAVALDYQPVTVIVDATAAATPDIHAANIFDMKNIGVATLTLQEWRKSERISALHQIACPFAKTDTATVLFEAIGYIRFLQGQIEALSSPYLGNSSRNTRNHQADEGEEKAKELRSRGLCLVPIS